MYRHWIVDQRSDPFGLQERLQFITTLGTDYIQMKNVVGFRSPSRQRYAEAGKSFVVLTRQTGTSSVLGVEMGQLDAQDCSLQLVQPRVPTVKTADIPIRPPVFA